jgi:hypothetical protein
MVLLLTMMTKKRRYDSWIFMSHVLAYVRTPVTMKDVFFSVTLFYNIKSESLWGYWKKISSNWYW